MFTSTQKIKHNIKLIKLVLQDKNYDNLTILTPIINQHLPVNIINTESSITDEINNINDSSIDMQNKHYKHTISNELFSTIVDNQNKPLIHCLDNNFFESVQIEMTKTTQYIYGMTHTNDNLYKTSFHGKEYHVYYAYKNKVLSLFIVMQYGDHCIHGCIISKNPTIGFHILIPTDVKTKDLKKLLQHTFTSYENFNYLCGNNLKSQLFDFNKKFVFAEPKMKIGLIYAKHNQQSCQSMLENRQKDVSLNYNNFTNLMEIPPNFEENNLFDDVFNDVKLSWYPSVLMSNENIRMHIGNVQCIIIYKDSSNLESVPFNTANIKELGNVNQIFIIVEPHEEHEICKIVYPTEPMKYRINCFYKGMKQYEPLIPNNYLFNGSDLRNLILTKLYNGLIALREDSNLSTYFQIPRQYALNELVENYSH